MVKGSKHSEETKKKQCEISLSLGLKPPSRKGVPGWNKGVKGYTNSGSFKKGHRFFDEAKKGWIKKGDIGEKSIAWRGWKTTINQRIRGSLEYKLWRAAVYKRDNYTCKFCGERGGILHADHIKQFAYHPELRFAIDNGRTLCEKCHKATDTYANNKKL